MKANFVTILDECIEEMRRGKQHEECLARYPDASPALAPLLQTAAVIRSAPKVQPSEAAMRAGKARFLQEAARLRAEKQKKAARPWQRLALVASTTFALPRPRPLAWAPALSIVLALVLTLCTATTAIAASRSLPDEPLYAIKLAAEQVQMTLTIDPVARADLALSITERRLTEITKLSSLGRPVAAPSIERLTSDSQEALQSISHIEDDAMRPRLQRYLDIVAQEQTVLSQVSTIPAIQETIAAALAIAQEHEKLATTAISDPSVLKETPPRTTRAPAGMAPDTPTPLPTPNPRRMRTPVAPPPTPTPEPPTPTATATMLLPTATPIPTETPVAPTPTASATIGRSPTPAPLPRVQFSGAVDSIGATEWIIANKTVRISDQTRIEGAAAAQPGAQADVVALVLPEQVYLALSIKVHTPSVTPNPITVRGIILSMSPTAWNIGGQAIAVSGATVIQGTPALGHIAEATGTQRQNNALLATAIRVKGPAPEVQFQGRVEQISPQAWVVGGQTVTIVPGLTAIAGTPGAGSSATVTALRAENGTLIAWRIGIQASPVEEEFEGVINRIDGNMWIISGRRVARDAQTRLDDSLGQARIGARARVRGLLQADGSILATLIRILGATGNSHNASPTVKPSPTSVMPPTPTPTTGAEPPAASPTPTVTPPGQHAAPTPTPRPTFIPRR